MKKLLPEFCRRGLLFAFLGPVVTAIVYCCLDRAGVVHTLSVSQAATAIFSTTAMAFIAAGITAVYSLEQLPLPMAVLLHAGVLYLDYLLIYLLNDWLAPDAAAIGIFTAVFLLGFALIWAVIFLCSRRRIAAVNRKLPK